MEHNSESDSSSRKSGNPKPEMTESIEIRCVRPGEQRTGTSPPPAHRDRTSPNGIRQGT